MSPDNVDVYHEGEDIVLGPEAGPKWRRIVAPRFTPTRLRQGQAWPGGFPMRREAQRGKECASEPVSPPDIVLVLGSPEFEVHGDNILEPFLGLGLLEPRRKPRKGKPGEALPSFGIELHRVVSRTSEGMSTEWQPCK